MLTSYAACKRKFQYEYLEHLTPPQLSIHLHAGSCFARGLEVARKAFYAEGRSVEDSILAGGQALLAEWGDYIPPDPGSPKRLERMIQGLGAYFREYPMHSDHIQPWKDEAGNPMIEYSFAHPIDVKHPTTGEPILYTGRFDMVGDYNGGCYAEDDKTTSQLGNAWLKNWHLRSQFTGYTWALQQDGYPCMGAIVRGQSFLKTSFGFAEVLELRANWMVESWYEQMCRRIERIKELWVTGIWDQNLDQSCASYGGCGFQKLCTVQNWESWVEGEYVRLRWNPVTGEREPVLPLSQEKTS
jgi:hypothetical protein